MNVVKYSIFNHIQSTTMTREQKIPRFSIRVRSLGKQLVVYNVMIHALKNKRVNHTLQAYILRLIDDILVNRCMALDYQMLKNIV